MQINSYDYQQIAQEFSKFFHRGSLTSSYKPILFKSIIYYLKKGKLTKLHKLDKENQIHFISIEQIARYFFRFNFVLYKKFKLKQLRSKNRSVKLYEIIDEYFPNDSGEKIPQNIPDGCIKQIMKQLFRNVIYLLRKDMYIYDFYDVNLNIIDIKQNLKDEMEFNRVLKDLGKHWVDIKYIGIPENIVHFIETQRPLLESAILANLAIFLETLNLIPNLQKKLMIADRTYTKMRNISAIEKKKLYSYQENRCFYCGDDMSNTPEADHFVPYDYLFDSKIWNIVGACQECNRKKRNFIVNEEYLGRVLERNLDNEFINRFFGDFEDLKFHISNFNQLLKLHYQNCLNYFKKISFNRKRIT
ncbi:HNH endonuclease domain-containing protein [Promethearchaeum syntrophicum]|uniref:HNH endonuclease domain-containing protein n=1 Tax=Promethearchaeum syntrophicum TaxID=2594042 RepID=A0A5B9DDV8_9ARCH|nr:HNH endonuclease domain-containing protein [Candidatus Prometheoarchaeum syntrophicum]QEE17181.1 hypothetical protein DSAG12_03013 [Candidatus Prometheoarchaeum syntrophicum]